MKTKPILASSAAKRKSAARVMVIPTPTAGPLMAAMIGFNESNIRRTTRPPPSRRRSSPSRRRSSPSASVPFDSALHSENVSAPEDRSAPAQNARPAPVRITARTASFASVESNASMSSFSIVVVNAFSLSGRSRVITAIPSSILIDMCSTGPSFLLVAISER